jgi:outer membrane protein assembly factor BamB
MAIGIAVVVPISILTADTARGAQSATSVPFGVSQPVTVPAKGTPLTVIGDSRYTGADDGSRLNAYSLRTGRQRNVLAGYAGVPPRPRWTVPDVPIFGVWRCGAALCGSDPGQSFALDPGSGEIRWRSPGDMLWRASDRLVYSSARIGGASGNEGTGIAVLDETTGRQLLRQDSWRPVTPIEGPRIPILAYSPAGQVLAVLDARRLNADRLALLPQGVPDCWAGKTYVTCRVGTDTFRAWRYSS